MTTRAQLRTSTRVAADQDNSTFPTDVALNDILDRAAKAVWRLMVRAGWKPDRTTQTITATGATAYNLSTDISVVHSVAYLGSSGPSTFRSLLRRVKPEELQDLLSLSNTGQAVAYDLIGGGTSTMSLELYPVPSSGIYEVRYTKRFLGFASDADNWYGPDGSDEVVILTAAVECILKEGNPANTLKAVQDRLDMRWTEVCDHAGFTDSTGQQTVRDTNRRNMLMQGFGFDALDVP